MAGTEFEDTTKLIGLFREWEIVEAKEMTRVTKGRIATIGKLQTLIEKDALEVPTLHNFLKEFPWVIDPRWNLVADEKTYSQLLRDEFPESSDELEKNKRIDFLCVHEGTNLIVVEIKRAKFRASKKDLDQIEEYVIFMREHIKGTTAPEHKYENVTGYLLCETLVDTPHVRGRRDNLANSQIYVKRYMDLLDDVKRAHSEFLERYDQLQQAKQDSL